MTQWPDLFIRKAWRRMRASPWQGLKKAWRILNQPGGLSGALDTIKFTTLISTQYNEWRRYHALTEARLAEMKEQLQLFSYQPLISVIVPTYNTEERWLRRAIESVREQVYPHWELCLADDASSELQVRQVLEEYHALDPRIKIIFRQSRGHISAASNSALTLACGEFVALLDHDDEISPDALFEVVQLLNQHPEADMIYSDEDKIEPDGSHTEPFFKPAWSPVLLMNANYITHFAVLRRCLIEKIGGFRDAFVGSQDYDLFLRFTEQTDKVFHIPKVLYSWRKTSTSTALLNDFKPYSQDALFRALVEAVQRRGLAAEVTPGSYTPFLRVRYKITGAPLISIVVPIPSDVEARALLKRLRQLHSKLTEQNYEFILVIHPEQVARLKKSLEAVGRCQLATSLETWPSAALATGARQARGDYLLFLAWELEPVNEGWLTALLELAQLANVGGVGAKILSKSGRLRHIGIALGIGGTVGYVGRAWADVLYPIFYFNLKDAIREVSAVSAACFMIQRNLFEQAGSFDPMFQNYFYDIDLCLRLSTQMGYKNLYTPYAQLRLWSDQDTMINSNVYNNHPDPHDKELFQQRWSNLLQKDSYYNPNLTQASERLSLRLPDQLLQ